MIVGEHRHCYTNERTRPSYFVTIPDYLFQPPDCLLPSSNLLPCNILPADLPFSRPSPDANLLRTSNQRQLTIPTPNDNFAEKPQLTASESNKKTNV